MSIFQGTLSLQPLKKAAGSVWRFVGQDCALCSGDARGELVCAACADALVPVGCACSRCALPLPASAVCGACLRRPPAFDDALAAFEYRFPLDRLVQRFKFAGDLAVGRWLALQLAHAAQAVPRPDVLVAPPLTRARLRERGFNQSVEVARIVGRELGIRVERAALVKTRETRPQPALGSRARRANLHGAFTCGLALDGRHVRSWTT